MIVTLKHVFLTLKRNTGICNTFSTVLLVILPCPEQSLTTFNSDFFVILAMSLSLLVPE